MKVDIETVGKWWKHLVDIFGTFNKRGLMNDTGKSAKLAKYDRLYEQIKGYIHTTEDIWARLATMEAVLHHKMQTFFGPGICVDR